MDRPVTSQICRAQNFWQKWPKLAVVTMLWKRSAKDTPAAVKAALDGQQMTIIVSKCRSGNIKVPVIDMDAPVIRDRFMREVARRNA